MYVYVMTKLTLIFAVFLAACAAGPAVTQNQHAIEKIARLWAEIGASNLAPPSVAVVQPAELAAMAKLPLGWNAARYYCQWRKMYISADQAAWGDEDWFSSLLVHELIHHKQCIEGRLTASADNCSVEVEAYTGQIAWLGKRGDEGGFIGGTNARNHAAYVERYMRKNYYKCL